MVNFILPPFNKEGGIGLQINPWSEDDDEKIGFLRDLALPVLLVFGLSEIKREGIGGERTGQDQRCYYLRGRIPTDVGKATLGRKDEVVE
jgi:hypothetical protein